MNYALMVGALSLLCIGCGSATVEAQPPDPTPAVAQPHNPDGVVASAARYSGEIGTVESDRTFSNFLYDNDGQWVELDVFISADHAQNYGEDWFTLCANAAAEDNCTAVSINLGENDFNALLLQAVEGGQKVSGYWIVRANPGMNQGFLSITLEPIP